LPGAGADEAPRRVFSGTECKFITHSAAREYRFCEAPVVENAKGKPSAYCAAHFDLCLVSPRKALEERKAQLQSIRETEVELVGWLREARASLRNQ
jgi:hypothetical protein